MSLCAHKSAVRHALCAATLLLGIGAIGLACVTTEPEPSPLPSPTPTPTPQPADPHGVWSTAFEAGDLGALSSVWGSGPDDVFVVGGSFAQGEIYHYDGIVWRAMGVPSVPLLVWVFGFSPDDVYAVGLGGGMVHYDGLAWTALDSGTDQDLWGIWGAAPDDIWVVGGTVGEGEPVLMHFDGAAFTPFPVPENDLGATALFKVWGIGSKVIAVGANGLVIERVGDTWSPVFVGSAANEDFVSLWGTSETNIVIVGGRSNAQIAHFDGITWTTRRPLGIPGLNGCFIDDADFAVIGGGVGWVGRYPPGAADPIAEPAPAEDDIHAIWGDGAGRYYAVGGQFRAPFRGVAMVRTPREPGIVPTRPIPADACSVDADCDDGSACTANACEDGVCVHHPLDCDDGDDCTTDTCTDGECSNDLIDCDDNDACTVNVCAGGACLYIPSDCDDRSACTRDTCVDGACLNVNTCGVGEICLSGACVPTPDCLTAEECDDGDACTVDECIDHGCINTATVCDDGDICTDDACVEGACVFMEIPGCACTVETDCELGKDCVDGVCQEAIAPDLEIGIGATSRGCMRTPYAPLVEDGELPICEGFQGFTDVLPDVRVTGFPAGAQVQVRGRLAYSGAPTCADTGECSPGQTCNKLPLTAPTGVCGPTGAQGQVNGTLTDLGGGVGQFTNFGMIIFSNAANLDGAEVVLTIQVVHAEDEATSATQSLNVTLEARRICLTTDNCPEGHTCDGNYCIP